MEKSLDQTYNYFVTMFSHDHTHVQNLRILSSNNKF